MEISKLKNGYWSETKTVSDNAPIPPGWIVAEAPTLAVGEAAKWVGEWVIVDKAEADARSQADLLQRREAEAKAECQRRIFAVFDQNAQINLTAAYAAGVLNAGQSATYLDGLSWIQSMRGAWPGIAASSADIHSDESWPTPGAAVIALGEAF